MRVSGFEPKVILGGLRSLSVFPYRSLLEKPRTIPFVEHFEPTAANSMDSLYSERTEDSVHPDLEVIDKKSEPSEFRGSITWMPSMIVEMQLHLGTVNHAGDMSVIKGLGITHVLSTSRVKPTKFPGLVYILVNKNSFSLSTLKLTNNFVTDAITGGGRVLVNGCDGLDQSAAIVVAFLMHRFTVSLEDALWYVNSSRLGVEIRSEWLYLLSSLEVEIFGKPLTDIESLWWKY